MSNNSKYKLLQKTKNKNPHAILNYLSNRLFYIYSVFFAAVVVVAFQCQFISDYS